MPLIILGLLVVIGIVGYWYIGNQHSDDPINPREVREHYSRAFEEKAKDVAKDVGDGVKKAVRKRAGIFDVDYDVEDDGYGGKSSSSDSNSHNEDSDNRDDNTIPFPQDVEREKCKRDIH
ncbi:MAG: hypothetical protein IJH57_04355 [Mogibacterium sp.]|nr:hypothetical protein [Mogibacterium sp.]